MCWISPHERAEECKLLEYFLAWRRLDDLHGMPNAVSIHPLPKVDMETNAKIRSLKCVGCCTPSARPADHETRAGNDALLMRGRHALVNTFG